jgi:hypothetical protein
MQTDGPTPGWFWGKRVASTRATPAGGKITSPNNELNGSPVGSAQLFCPNSCHDFCGKLGNMQEQKSRQQLGQKSSFSSNALDEILFAFFGAKKRNLFLRG